VLPRFWPVELEVPARRHQPSLLFVPQRELADHPLSALEIAVEDVDRQRLCGLDRRSHCLEDPGRRIALSALPKSDVARRQVNIPDLGGELLDRRVRPRRREAVLHIPPV